MKKIYYIMWALLIVLTIAVYMLIFKDSEHGGFFALNLVTGLVSVSLILYGFSSLVPSNLSRVQSLSKRTVVVGYAITILLWTSIISLVQEDNSVTTILIGDTILTIVLVFLLGSTSVGEILIDEEEGRQGSQKQVKEAAVFSIENWQQQLEDSLNEITENDKDQIISDARSIVDKIEAIPLKKVSDNEWFLNSVKGNACEITELSEQLKTSDSKEALIKQIADKVSRMRSDVERKKNRL